MTDLVRRDDVLALFEGREIEFHTTLGQIKALPAVKPRVAANISGGLLQGASADYPVDIYALDFDDVPDDEPENTILLDGKRVHLGQTGCQVEPEFVRSVVEAPTEAQLAGCENGLHSWISRLSTLSPDTECDFCGETYGCL